APDPLACLESEERVGFYRQRELPAAIFDGRASLGCEGEAEAAQETYENCLEAILPRLDAPSGAKLSLEATRKGEKITVKATVADVKGKFREARLLVALVEDDVTYRGLGGVPRYDGVVRAFAGGADGVLAAGKEDKEDPDKEDGEKKEKEKKEKK